MSKMVTNIKQAFSFGTGEFDPSNRFVTSWLLTPWALFGFRAFISLYAFTVLLFSLIWTASKPSYGGSAAATFSFSYFTILTYWGLAFYFLVSAIHTFTYIQNGHSLLSRFPRPLQALHSLYYTTVIGYPLLVTLVFWAVLFNSWWPDRYNQWTNVSEHGLNSLFAIFEIVVPRTQPPPFVHALFLCLILCGYLCVAYITHATRGVYVYSFFAPTNGNGIVAAYCIGIAVGICVLFVVAKYLVTLRLYLTETKGGRSGKFSKGDGARVDSFPDVELVAANSWKN